MTIDVLIALLHRRRTSIARLLRQIEKSRDGDGWEPIALSSVLRDAAADPGLEAEIREVAAKAGADAEGDARKRLLELAALIREICLRRKWRLDGEWPRFFVERGIEVRIDEEQRSLAVSDITAPNLSAKTIERILETGVEELLPRLFDPRQFLVALARAYDAARGDRETQVPVWDIYRELILASQPKALWRDARARRFQEFAVDQFRARLSAILEAGETTAPDGRELRLLAPLDPKQGIFVYQPAERRFGFVGRIEFVRLES
jgi:hypothetical protein